MINIRKWNPNQANLFNVGKHNLSVWLGVYFWNRLIQNSNSCLNTWTAPSLQLFLRDVPRQMLPCFTPQFDRAGTAEEDSNIFRSAQDRQTLSLEGIVAPFPAHSSPACVRSLLQPQEQIAGSQNPSQVNRIHINPPSRILHSPNPQPTWGPFAS